MKVRRADSQRVQIHTVAQAERRKRKAERTVKRYADGTPLCAAHMVLSHDNVGFVSILQDGYLKPQSQLPDEHRMADCIGGKPGQPLRALAGNENFVFFSRQNRRVANNINPYTRGFVFHYETLIFEYEAFVGYDLYPRFFNAFDKIIGYPFFEREYNRDYENALGIYKQADVDNLLINAFNKLEQERERIKKCFRDEAQRLSLRYRRRGEDALKLWLKGPEVCDMWIGKLKQAEIMELLVPGPVPIIEATHIVAYGHLLENTAANRAKLLTAFG